jgi:phage gp29-like protein
VLFDMGYAPNIEYVVETYGEGFRPAEKGEASPIALNGAQVTALTDVISQAINDGWIPELAVATIQASFPTIGVELIQAIAEQLQAQADKTTIQPESSDTPIVPADQPAPVSAEFAEKEPDTVDLYTDRLRTTAGKEVDGWVDQISGLLDTAGDLNTFSETLLTLYPDLKGDRLRDIMGDAVLAASIAGSLEGDA